MCECDCNKKDNYDCGYVSNCRYRDVNGKCGCDPKRNCPGSIRPWKFDNTNNFGCVSNYPCRDVDVTQKLNGQVVLVHVN